MSLQLAAAAVSTAAAAAAEQSSPSDVTASSPLLDLSSDEFVGNLRRQTD